MEKAKSQLERLMCKECNQKFFGGEFNKYSCPKCHTAYIRKSKKVDMADFIPTEVEEDI
jgi:Zn finger protein HypA/HybF involved in hydrogenase expression